MAEVEAPALGRRRPAVQVAGVIVAMLLAYALLHGRAPWPNSLALTQLPGELDRFQGWLIDQRSAADQSSLFALFDAFRFVADWLVMAVDNALHWMTWVGAAGTGILLVARFGGWRAGLTVAIAFVCFAAIGLWEESVQTLALMLAAVLLSLAIGMPLGVWAGCSPRVYGAIAPLLDAMQIVPAFAYLMPVVILFSVGASAAVICTMIYAIPPAVRITALGVRSVPAETVEAATAMGATQAQLLWKVQLPLARRQLLLAVNQTIMFALSFVVIAGLIGGRGLGDIVTNGLYSNAALALLAGIAIVIMAVALDRSFAAISARRQLTNERQRLLTLAMLAAIVVIVLTARALGADPSYPRHFETATTIYQATVQDQLVSAFQSVLGYVQNPASFVFGISEPVGNFLVKYGLEPLRVLLTDSPWFVVLAGLTAIAWIVIGLRAALTTFTLLALIGILGEWEPAMDTTSQVLVATTLAVLVGVGLGIFAGESRRINYLLRPLLDTLQTLPQLVYIIPVIYLMPVSVVPGVVASVLYAAPVVIRLVASGLRGVQRAAVEAGTAFGATRWQVLAKVKLPLARDSVMLGVNQGIVMVLAVVVIGGLVGSGALGDEVARGLQRNEFGGGVVASLAIFALGIALDRITRGRATGAGITQ